MSSSLEETVNNIKQSNRNGILDIFRALALITIFINHNPPTVFEYMTHKNFGFSDATEVFVLISGIALAYSSRLKVDAFRMVILKAWKRVGILYCAHLLTTFSTLVIFCGLAGYFCRPDLYNHSIIKPFIETSHHDFFAIIILKLQLGYNNILPLYMVLIFLFPFIMFIANKSLYFLLVLSSFIYLLAGLFAIAPYNSLEQGTWFLNPFSWQFLFIIGIAATLYIKDGGKISRHPLLFFAAFSYLFLSFVWVRWNLWEIDIKMGLPQRLAGFNKTFLSIPRLLHIIALSYTFAFFLQTTQPIWSNKKNPLIILGRHSLPVFITGTILSMLGKAWTYLFPNNFLFNHIFLIAGFFALFALAYCLEWFKQSSVKTPAFNCISRQVKLT